LKYPASAPTLPDSFWEELAEENPGLGNNITAQDVKDWFYLCVWLRYKLKPFAHSRDEGVHRYNITRWWSWAQGFEVVEARHRRAVGEGRRRPREHSAARPGTREMPQEPRYHQPDMLSDRKENSLGTVLRAIGGGK
jgi:hypothetical protein